jgi:hypothetical protein
MTTFHPQQFNRGRCAHQKAGASALQNSVTNCTAKLRGYAHEAGKSSATIFKEQCKSTSLNLNFRHRKPYPLSKQGFYGSPISRRCPRGVPRDGRAMGANHLARNPAKCLTSYPRNVLAMAGQWQQQCHRTSVKTARKTTRLAPDLAAPCPRRKLARQLAICPRNDQCNVSQAAHRISRRQF